MTSLRYDATTVRVATASLVAAPVLVLASALAMPKLASDEQEQLRIIAAHDQRYLWYTVLLLVGTMLFVPAFHGLAVLVPDSRGTRIGAALAVFGAMASVGDTTTQFLIRELATKGGGGRAMADSVTAFDSSPGAAQLFALGGLALVAGGITVAVALRRAGLVPTPAGVCVSIAFVANLLGFIVGSIPLIAGSAVLLSLGLGVVALGVLRAARVATATAGAVAPVGSAALTRR
jgi:hypothetical protein